MWQLVVEGRDPQQRSKHRLANGPVIVGRGADSDIPSPWELALSRRHVLLQVTDASVTVERLPTAINPIFYQGEPADRFVIAAGERFAVGETTFSLQQLQAMSPLPELPVQEITFTRAELDQVQFEDSDRRLEALARLPAVISHGLDQEEQATHLAGLILAGIRHAEAAAVLTLSAAGALNVSAWERRTETQGAFRPSAGLVRDAVAGWRSVLHVWESHEAAASNYTVPADFDWAFFTPVARVQGESWGIYVTGSLDQPLSESHPLKLNLQSDVRFAQLIGEVVSSSERMNRMEGQLSVLRQFLSPPILTALEETGRQGDLNVDLLQPRVCDVTVLFCDVRGFSHRAETALDDLPGLLARVSGALELMTRAILEHGGVTGDFLGDAVLGFWGWPFASEEAPLKACRAALEIRRQFARIQSSRHHPLADFRVGVGVAHGRAVAGKIGAGGRVSVTVFGPVVNLASRLEGLTKRLQVPVILDEATARLAADRLSHEEGRIRKLATVVPYGMETALTVSELIPSKQEFPELSDEHLRMFEAGVEHFRQGRWDEAYRAFHAVPSSDQAQDFLLSLITQHNRSAPPGWKGVIELPGK